MLLLSKCVHQALVECLTELPDLLPKSVERQYGLCSTREAYAQIHQPTGFESLERARKRLVFEEFFLFWKEKRDFLEAFDKSKLIGLLVEHSTSYAMSEFINIRKFLTEGEDREKIHVFQFTICGLMTLTVDWYRSGYAESVPEIARTAARLISKPLFPNLDKMGIQT